MEEKKKYETMTLGGNLVHSIIATLNNNETKKSVDSSIGEHILKNLDTVSTMGIEELAESCYTSTATVSRYIKKLGYRNYAEFKEEVLAYCKCRDREFNLGENTEEEIIDEVFVRNINNLKRMKKTIDKQSIIDIVDLIAKKKNIYFFGIDYSQIVAQDAQLKFINVEKIGFTFISEKKYYEIINTMTQDDLAIFITISGENKQLIRLQERLKNTENIAITNSKNSTIGKNASHVLEVNLESDGFALSATTERTAMFTIVDLLYLVYAKRHQ